jgi:ribosomal protein S27AE
MVDAPKKKPLYNKGDRLLFPYTVKKGVLTVDKVTTDAIGSDWYYVFKEAPDVPMTELRLVNSKVEKVEQSDMSLLCRIYEKKVEGEFEPCPRCGGTEVVGWGKMNTPMCKRCQPAKIMMKRKDQRG